MALTIFIWIMLGFLALLFVCAVGLVAVVAYDCYLRRSENLEAVREYFRRTRFR